MEFSLQNNDKSERISCSSEEQAQVKSYTCDFCKRGFSNAQALGGHMNIHRKDRAKLRQQSSEENLLSLDISIKNPHENVETNNNHKRPSIFPEAKVNIGISSEISQFPIFVGRASGDYNISNEIIRASNGTSVVVEGIEENKMGLDLELRLGPERVQETAPTLRQFF